MTSQHTERADRSDSGVAVAAPEPTRSRRTIVDRIRNRQAGLLASPLYLIVAVIILVPLGYLAYAAFQTGSPGAPGNHATLDNVRAVVAEPSYRLVLWNTLKLALMVTIGATILGVSMAWLVARTNVPGRKLLEVLIPLPLFMSPFAGGVAWVFLGSESAGLINVVYRQLTGAETSSSLVNIFSFGGLVFTMVIFLAPYAYLFTIGPLRNMDASLEEASRVHGGSYRRTMFRITFPLVLPGITSAVLMIFVLASEMFSLPSLIGVPAGYYTLPYFIYQSTHFSPPNWPLAAAAGLLLLVIMAIGVTLQRYATKASARYVTVGGKGAGVNRVNIGRWRWAGGSLCYLYVGLAIVLPFIALLIGSAMRYFTPRFSMDLITWHNWDRILTSGRFIDALENTLIVAVIGPIIGLTLGFALSYLWQRMRAPFSRTVETVSMLPIAIPGIVMGVGLVWAFVKSPLYGTLGMLLVAYVARYLPHALRIFQSTVVQVDPALDEASRVSGAGLLRTLRNVSLPLMRHSTLSAWLLLFILMVRELNVAIMVYTSNTTVLPVLLWSEIEGGQYGGAAVISMVEVGIITLAFIVARKIFGVDLVNTMSRNK